MASELEKAKLLMQEHNDQYAVASEVPKSASKQAQLSTLGRMMTEWI